MHSGWHVSYLTEVELPCMLMQNEHMLGSHVSLPSSIPLHILPTDKQGSPAPQVDSGYVSCAEVSHEWSL